MKRWTCDLCGSPNIHSEPQGTSKVLCCEAEIRICCGNSIIAHVVAVEHEQEHVRQHLAEMARQEKLKETKEHG